MHERKGLLGPRVCVREAEADDVVRVPRPLVPGHGLGIAPCRLAGPGVEGVELGRRHSGHEAGGLGQQHAVLVVEVVAITVVAAGGGGGRGTLLQQAEPHGPLRLPRTLVEGGRLRQRRGGLGQDGGALAEEGERRLAAVVVVVAAVVVVEEAQCQPHPLPHVAEPQRAARLPHGAGHR